MLKSKRDNALKDINKQITDFYEEYDIRENSIKESKEKNLI